MSKLPTLPVMNCDDNCGECCGIAPCTDAEFNAIQKYAQQNNIQPVDQGLTCPWYQKGKCQVHPVRPAVCQLFGHTDRMRCSRGHNVNITGVPLRRWNNRIKNANRYTHQAITGWTPKKIKRDLNNA